MTRQKEKMLEKLQEKRDFYLAKNFFIVLSFYGIKFWPKLENIFNYLCEQTLEKNKIFVISSFYEICKNFSQEKIEKDFLPKYDLFLESPIEKTKQIAIKYLPKILNLVSKEKKQKYEHYLNKVAIFRGNFIIKYSFIHWKNKLDVIEGISCYYDLYEYDIIFKMIVPQCITFCLDQNYRVRTNSSKILAKIILYLYKNNYMKIKLFEILKTFALNRKFQQRINFIKMCKVLMYNDKDIYNEKIMELLFKITLNEKILNVKIALCKLLKKIILNDKSPLYGELSIHALCKIIMENNNNYTIKNILMELKLYDINVDKNFLFNKFCNNFNFENMYVEENEFFIEEFNIGNEDVKEKHLHSEEFITPFEDNQNKKGKIELMKLEVPKENKNIIDAENKMDESF